MLADLPTRLRFLRAQNNWTVADMAERTGIPKRTLDKYLLRDGASLPGFETLLAMSKGLGVSLDWLVKGSGSTASNLDLLVQKAVYDTAIDYFEMLLREGKLQPDSIFKGETILNLRPEEWAADIASRSGEQAGKLAGAGVSDEQLLIWRDRIGEISREILRDRFESLKTE